ncbi:hypothetical protein F3J16_18145 [Burkholderia sp. Ap-962]|uniref:hypothetical protein n=1 Tax=Burkholderia sp. Ap-962 TaxID=2608333 RepID=UPI0014208110|nr:hypothetical protein [Burkholderia sp. Ap-962]NIF72094.1 hypothetical protein [Burkholderia sp. Ap-962]
MPRVIAVMGCVPSTKEQGNAEKRRCAKQARLAALPAAVAADRRAVAGSRRIHREDAAPAGTIGSAQASRYRLAQAMASKAWTARSPEPEFSPGLDTRLRYHEDSIRRRSQTPRRSVSPRRRPSRPPLHAAVCFGDQFAGTDVDFPRAGQAAAQLGKPLDQSRSRCSRSFHDDLRVSA